MAGRSSQDVLGRARRDAARFAAERAELLVRREAIDHELGLLEAQCARVQIVIDYCESDTAGDAAAREETPGSDAPPPGAQEGAGAPASGRRRPDLNAQGLTRAQIAHRMLDETVPCSPRAIAEAFHGTDQVNRRQVESVRRVLRKQATAGSVRMLPDGTYLATPARDPLVEQPVGPTVADTQDTSAHVGAWVPRLIPGLAADSAAVPRPPAGALPYFPFAVNAEVLLQLLATAARPMRALELAQALGREPSDSQLESIRQSLRRCVERGDAVLVERGQWAIAPALPAEARRASL